MDSEVKFDSSTTQEDFETTLNNHSNPDEVLSIFINECMLTDLKCLSRFRNLKILNLECNEIIDLAALGDLVNLEELYLSNNKILDVGPLAT